MAPRPRHASHLSVVSLSESSATTPDSGLWPQHIGGCRLVLTVVAAGTQEVRPIWVPKAVLAAVDDVGVRSDRGPLDPGERPVARANGFRHDLVQIPADQSPITIHHLARDHHMANRAGVHHGHDRAVDV